MFWFPFQRNRNRHIFFEPFKIPIVFGFISFSCEGSFFSGQQSSKGLSADRLRCEHRRFYMVTSVGLVSYIVPDLGLRGKLLTNQTSFLVQPYARLARIALRNFTSLFSPATVPRANSHETHVRERLKAISKRYASEPTQDKLNRDRMADVIALERPESATRGCNVHNKKKKHSQYLDESLE